MLKTLLLNMLQGGIPLLLLIGALVGLFKFFRQLKDPAWLLAALLSVALLIGGIAFQASRFADDVSGNELLDVTYVSYLIAPLFALATGINALSVFRFSREQREEAKGIEGSVRRRLRERRVLLSDKEAALTQIHDELLDRESLPLLIKQTLPTLGLIGTVAGLSMAMGDLGDALSAAIGGGQGNSDDLLKAMQEAMKGMGGAFLTTLIGAGFGLLLLVLTNRTARLIGQVLIDADKKLEQEDRTSRIASADPATHHPNSKSPRSKSP
jgi:biopolymer transport protein ExbB/TolQ